MKEKKRDKDLVKEAVGDPAFYNDQIGKDKEPFKETMEKKKGNKFKE
ncbi:MAG: hypothetical protein N3I35_02135 [Clostridia bacterium]|nr:hypothetical protein [Clostridia bacterium]